MSTYNSTYEDSDIKPLFYTLEDGTKFMLVTDRDGRLRYARLGDAHYESSPQEGTNYVHGYHGPGNYREVTSDFRHTGWLDPLYEVIVTPDAIVDKEDDMRPELNVIATIPETPSLFQVASEDQDIQNARERDYRHDSRVAEADNTVSKMFDEKGKFAGMMGAGVAAGLGGGWLLSTFTPEVLGALNLYSGYHGLTNFGDNLSNAFNGKTTQDKFWNGLFAAGNALEMAIPGGMFIGNAVKPVISATKPLILATKTYGLDKTADNLFPIFNAANKYGSKITSNAISQRRFRPLTTYADRKNYVLDLENRFKNNVMPFSKEIQQSALDKRNLINFNNLMKQYQFASDVDSRISDLVASDPIGFRQLGFDEDYIYNWASNEVNKAISNLKTPVLSTEKVPDINLNRITFGKQTGDFGGYFEPSTNRIHMITRRPDAPFYYDPSKLENIFAHELGHYWLNIYGDIGAMAQPYKGYYGVNTFDSKAKELYSPLLKYTEGEWVGSPNEVLSEINYLMNYYKTTDLLNNKHADGAFDYMARRFGISLDEAKEMVTNSINQGMYKEGGKL